MLFNGSTNFKPGELVKYFQSIGMQFGADANAHTGFNETVYDILLPQGDRKNLKKGLTVIKDYAEGALLLPSEIDSERRVVLAEKRTRDSAEYRTYIATLNFEFPHAKISKRLPIGKEEILKKADHKRLKEFYDSWYRPEKMILVMVGDFDTQAAISLIKENFSSLSSRAPPVREPDVGKINHFGIKPFYHLEKEAGNTTTSIEVVEKVSKEPDSFQPHCPGPPKC
jgi:zinc protease